MLIFVTFGQTPSTELLSCSLYQISLYKKNTSSSCYSHEKGSFLRFQSNVCVCVWCTHTHTHTHTQISLFFTKTDSCVSMLLPLTTFTSLKQAKGFTSPPTYMLLYKPLTLNIFNCILKVYSFIIYDQFRNTVG